MIDACQRTAETPAAEVWECTHSEYHARKDRIGNSMKETFRDSRRRYEAEHVTQTIPHESTAALRFGTLFHVVTLEPQNFDNLIAVEPDVNRRTKVGKAELAKFHRAAERDGKTVVRAKDVEHAQAMAEAVLEHPTAGRWLSDCERIVEQAITWTDETGLQLKAKRDIILDGGRIVVDLKSAREVAPAAFVRACVTFGYHRQAPWYLAGEAALELPCDLRFAFIVCGKDAPHEVAVYELDEYALDLGRRQNRAALNALAECYATGDWRSPWEKVPQVLSLPPWADNASAWEI